MSRWSCRMSTRDARRPPRGYRQPQLHDHVRHSVLAPLNRGPSSSAPGLHLPGRSLPVDRARRATARSRRPSTRPGPATTPAVTSRRPESPDHRLQRLPLAARWSTTGGGSPTRSRTAQRVAQDPHIPDLRWRDLRTRPVFTPPLAVHAEFADASARSSHRDPARRSGGGADGRAHPAGRGAGTELVGRSGRLRRRRRQGAVFSSATTTAQGAARTACRRRAVSRD